MVRARQAATHAQRTRSHTHGWDVLRSRPATGLCISRYLGHLLRVPWRRWAVPVQQEAPGDPGLRQGLHGSRGHTSQGSPAAWALTPYRPSGQNSQARWAGCRRGTSGFRAPDLPSLLSYSSAPSTRLHKWEGVVSAALGPAWLACLHGQVLLHPLGSHSASGLRARGDPEIT